MGNGFYVAFSWTSAITLNGFSKPSPVVDGVTSCFAQKQADIGTY